MNTVSGSVSMNTSMAKGEFYKPEVVLDNVARSTPTEDGVIVITTRDVTGRIGILNNNTIIGGVVDGTGETAIAAVCKLLLLPYGSYTFRRATPVDKIHLGQDLNLKFDEAKRFLQGPSSIGLASPAEHVLSNIRPKPTVDGLAWESTNLRATFETTSESGEQVVEPEPYASTPADSGVYMHDCNALLDAIVEKRKEEMFVTDQPRRTATDLPLLAGPLPSRKREKNTLGIVVLAVAVSLVLGLAGYSSLKPSHHQAIAEQAAPYIAAAEQASTDAQQTSAVGVVANGANPPVEETPQTGSAPYSFPSSSQQTSPPPNPAPPAAPEAQAKAEAPEPGAPALIPATASVPIAHAVSNPHGNQEVLRCSDLVRANPGDPKARTSLAYAYLQIGDANNSIKQFYSAMKMTRVETNDILQYADNMVVFCGRGAAKQFLSDVLRSDPGQSAVRERLNTL